MKRFKRTSVVGVLPAAGRGSRLGAIPSSKEIMPLGFGHAPDTRIGWQPLTTIERHLAGFRAAGVQKVVIVLGPGKSDIMEYLRGGEQHGLSITYAFQERPRGMPFALDLARPWSAEAQTVFAMPDTLIEPYNAISRLTRHHRASGADVSLGLFETDNPAKYGMVDVDDQGRARAFVDKPKATTLRWMWGLAVWSPEFASFMGDMLGQVPPESAEVVLSDVFDAAMRAGLRIDGVRLNRCRYNDIGTPEEFQHVVHRLAEREREAQIRRLAA